MFSKKILAAAAVATLIVLPLSSASAAGGYLGYTTKGVKHWIPDPSQHSLAWFQKWLAKEHAAGRDYNFDSRG